jgi:hypothetical protein
MARVVQCHEPTVAGIEGPEAQRRIGAVKMVVPSAPGRASMPDSASKQPAYAAPSSYYDAPPAPLKRGWFHAGVRVARMYWYVGAGVTMFVGLMFGVLGVDYGVGGGGGGSQASAPPSKSITPGDGTPGPGDATATAAVEVWARGLATSQALKPDDGGQPGDPPPPTRIGEGATPRPRAPHAPEQKPIDFIVSNPTTWQ